MIDDDYRMTHILLVDEDITFLTTLLETLRIRFEQLNITTCSCAQCVLEQIVAIDFDVVICNIKLSDMDGLHLLKLIRHQRPSLPVLFITSYNDCSLTTKVIQLGAYDLIHKPINWGQFEASLGSALSMRSVERIKQALYQQEDISQYWNLLTGIKVLIVDDDRDCLEYQSATLRSWSAEVKTASSVQVALNVIQTFKPDLIICDIRMPYENGYGLIRKIRRGTGTAGQIPAIAITAYANEEDRQHALQAGFQLQLEKPIDPTTLVLSVANLMGRTCLP